MVLSPILMTLIRTNSVISASTLLMLATPLLSLSSRIKSNTTRVSRGIEQVRRKRRGIRGIQVILRVTNYRGTRSIRIQDRSTNVLMCHAILSSCNILL